MPVKKLKDFLSSHNIKYVTISHSPAYTAQEIAAMSHISGKNMAKTVIVNIDNETVMLVLQASCGVDFDLLKKNTGADTIELASEQEFKNMFQGCETGAMPPFGNLYGMKVYVEERLTKDEEISFNAGSHIELIKMAYKDYENVVKPEVFKFAYK